MTDQAVLYEVSAGVATITLNRPESRNALSPAVLDGLGDHLGDALADPAARVVVLTNTGTVFCAGADLKRDGDEQPRHTFVGVLETMLDAGKPIVGRIAGNCFGGGNGLAAACDISIAAEDTQFGFTEVRIGVAPAVISVVCLPKLRRTDALELFLTGERIPAERAAAVGLVNRASPRGKLDEEVAATVEALLAGAPAALAAAKQLVSQVPGMDRAAAFGWTAALSAALFASEEGRAGRAAFRERRAAPWVQSLDRAATGRSD